MLMVSVEDDFWRQNRHVERSGTYAGIHNGSHRILLKLRKSIPAVITIVSSDDITFAFRVNPSNNRNHICNLGREDAF